MRRLLASIHDVSPRFEAEVDQLADLFARHLNGPRFAMLVVPDHWDASPLERSPAFARRLRGWADAGVEMFLHGWRHRDDAPTKGFAQRHMTAGEGEFAALTRDEARTRMQRGRAVVEDAIGRPVAGFIAPAWLYSAGSRDALADEGFALAEDHLRVWRPRDGLVLARGPVITWASRSRPRQLSSLAVAAMARNARVLLRPTARIAVHPGDTAVPELLLSVAQTVGQFAKTHQPSRYADLSLCASSPSSTA